MALALMIDGVDFISELVHESLCVSQTGDGLNSTCTFDLTDEALYNDDFWTVGVTRVEDGDVITTHVVFPDTKVEVSVVDGATVYFAGILSRSGVTRLGKDGLTFHCECHDFNQMLEESVVDDLEEYGAATDEEIIDDIFPKYVTGIDFATYVTGPFVSDEISFNGCTVRQVLDTLAAKAQYVWYVDYSKKLHYNVDGTDAPAWHLSDSPDDVNSFSFFNDIAKEEDATNLVNRVFIIGNEIGLWFQNAASIAKYGTHQAIIRDTNLIDIDDMEDRADAILAKHGGPVVTYNLKTFKDGLRAGMNIRLVCALFDVDDTFLINSLDVSFPVDGAPVYAITCGGLSSSTGASAHRLTLDHRTTPPAVAPGQLPLASRGWGHDLTFSATDDDTVAWGAGTITTAGGQEFAIAAGDTDDPGAMTEKTIVYLDTAISLTELQMTTDETAALGTNRIMVAVAWPSGEATVDAGFQVFGATGELATYLNATNIIADCITANEIYGNTLSVIAADMGTLTAGEIRMIGVDGSLTITPAGIKLFDGDDPAADNVRLILNTTDGKFTFLSATAGNPRITIDNTEIAGYDGADVLQFQLKASDGKAYAGAGAVVLDETGLRMVGSGATDDPRRLRFMYDDAGTERQMGLVTGDWTGGIAQNLIWLQASRQAGDPWPADVGVILSAVDIVAGTSVRLYVQSGRTIKSTGEYIFKTTALLRPGTGTSDPTNAVEDGCLFYRTDTDKLRLRANGAWVNLN